MIPLAVLFSVASYPSDSDNYLDDDSPSIAGLAEWFLTVPDLFLLLLGADAAVTPFALYGGPETNKALVAETTKAQQRWQSFYQLVRQIAPERLPQLAPIHDLLMATQHAYLALDVWGSAHENQQSPKAYATYVKALLAKAKLLDSALAQSTPEHVQDPIAQMLTHWQQSLGYWSADVIAHVFEIDYEPLEKYPKLSEWEQIRNVDAEDADEEASEHFGWFKHIPAYVVRKKGAPKEADALGVVTPYGRWLVPIDLGMNTMIEAHSVFNQHESLNGWLVATYCKNDQDYNTLEYNSVLFDVNGVQVTPVLNNTALYVASPTVGHIDRKHVGGDHEKHDIVRLPDLSVIEADTLEGIMHSDDGYLHFRKEHALFYDGEQHHRSHHGVMRADGHILIPANKYDDIKSFTKGKSLAVASVFDPTKQYGHTHLAYGVIDSTGKEIIPCQYMLISTPRGSDKPKVYLKDRLLALDSDSRPVIYKTNGELVCATPYTVHHMFTHLPLMGGANNHLLVMHEDFMWQMSFDGELVQRDISVADFTAQLQNTFSRWDQNPAP